MRYAATCSCFYKEPSIRSCYQVNKIPEGHPRPITLDVAPRPGRIRHKIPFARQQMFRLASLAQPNTGNASLEDLIVSVDITTISHQSYSQRKCWISSLFVPPHKRRNQERP